MAIFTVTLHGVPIAVVDLPVDRTWAGGRVTPLPGFASLVPLLDAAREAPALVVRLLELPRGDVWPAGAPDDLPAHVGTAYAALATLPFELQDEAGLPAGADLVRLAPIGGTPDAVVRVYFRHAPASAGVRTTRTPTIGGNATDAPGA